MKKEIYDEYVGVVCDHFGITEDELFTKSKKTTFVDARHLLVYLCRTRGISVRYMVEYLADSGYEIGHSTVIHSYNEMMRRIEDDDDLRYIIERLKAKV